MLAVSLRRLESEVYREDALVTGQILSRYLVTGDVEMVFVSSEPWIGSEKETAAGPAQGLRVSITGLRYHQISPGGLCPWTPPPTALMTSPLP